jgi:hypothetical protein
MTVMHARILPLLGLALLAGCAPWRHHTERRAPELIAVTKIWDAGRHNAFTDLVLFRGAWFCAFREAEAHVGGNGQIRVLTSRDGTRWESAALVSEAGIDLRDPKFSVTPDGRLMLSMGGSWYEGKKLIERQPRVAFSKDGREWTAPQRILDKGEWLWRMTWHDGRAYGITYNSSPEARNPAGTPDWTVKLVESTDGVQHRVVTALYVPGHPNEGTLRFTKDGRCVALLRREGIGANSDRQAWIGESRAPFTQWNWKPAGLFIGGPNFVLLPNGTMLAAGRQMNPAPAGPKTFIGPMTLEAVTPELILPSGGDTSYPGLVLRGDTLWMSYYSSHEGKSAIYLARVRVR